MVSFGPGVTVEGACGGLGITDGASHDATSYGHAATYAYGVDTYENVLVSENAPADWRPVGDATLDGDCLTYNVWAI
jgi:hypothetical protein